MTSHCWKVDWNGDGRYDHPASDITPILESWGVRFGASTRGNSEKILPALTSGELLLDNTRRGYDPDSTAQIVDENKLRSRNPTRLVAPQPNAPDRILWEGFSSAASKANLSRRDQIRYLLTSKFDNPLKNAGEMNLRGPTTIEEVLTEFQRLTAEQSGGVGVDVEHVNEAIRCGPVYFNGPWLNFLELLGNYSGGWCMEDQLGTWRFRQWNTSHPIRARFPLSAGPLAFETGTAERSGYVRNSAVPVAYKWLPELRATESGTGTEVDPDTIISFASVVVPSGQSRTVHLKFTGSVDRWPVSWETFEVVNDPAPNNVIVLSNFVRQNNFYYTCTATARAYSGADRVFDIEARGRSDYRKQISYPAVSDRYFTNVFDSQTVYGRRDLDLPPWFPENYDGVFSNLQSFMLNLSQPPEIIAATYYDHRSDLQRFGVPGNAVEITTEDDFDGSTTVRSTLIAETEILGGWKQIPKRLLFGVGLRNVPPPPLTATVEAILARTAIATVGVSNPALEPIYGRIQEKP